MSTFDLSSFDVKKYDEILSRGLCYGLGDRVKGKVCIEAAICWTLGQEHSDDPQCVAASVRKLKLSLNDCNWTSDVARAKGLRDLGLAQLGSLGVIDDNEFTEKLTNYTITKIIPELFTELKLGAAEDRELCVKDDLDALIRLRDTAYENYRQSFNSIFYNHNNHMISPCLLFWCANFAADCAVRACAGNDSVWSCVKCVIYTSDATKSDKYLLRIAELALNILRDLKSPGISLLDSTK